MNIIQNIKNALEPLTTSYRFPDGTYIYRAHKMALRIDIKGRFFLIGFEPAFERGVDRLIHEGSIFQQISSGEKKELDPIVRAEIMQKVKDYCSVKKLTFRIVD